MQVLVHPWYLSHPSLYQQTLGFLVLFGVVLLQILVHPWYLSLYQQTLGFLVLFGAVLLQVFIHPQYFGLYQRTLRFLALFEAVLLQTSLPTFFHVPKNHHPYSLLHSSSAKPYHCMQIVLQDLLWSPSTFLTQYCDSFFWFSPVISSRCSLRKRWYLLLGAFLAASAPVFVAAFTSVLLHLLWRLIISISSTWSSWYLWRASSCRRFSFS